MAETRCRAHGLDGFWPFVAATATWGTRRTLRERDFGFMPGRARTSLKAGTPSRALTYWLLKRVFADARENLSSPSSYDQSCRVA